MLSFVNDYCEGAHQEILEKLTEINFEKQAGYMGSRYCESAAEKIRAAISCPNAEVFFLTGGTQTNQLAIDTLLKPYEGVVATRTGHVEAHESGAIEFTGHKVLTIPSHNGKMDAGELHEYVKKYYGDESWDHIVTPGMVYISQPTELGTLYTREELAAIRKVCDEYRMPLYMDGARLAEALAADETLTLSDYALLTDAFYIGGTKCGALFGEALVFTKGNMPERFLSRVKQHGALLAKGWIVAVQYDVMFTDDLYIRGGRNAVEKAAVIKKALKEKGYEFYVDSPTNQIFVVMDKSRAEALSEKVNYTLWEDIGDSRVVIRFVTSWATGEADVKALTEVL
ncbi:MAG: aminotransferase class I/II-fold pyridoxal phosphate-dependent enzyme [Lachnospiraceae bacterium]|nr:aminotransferase class I/II-fold pyridoxal phosphate-dependent enzyme [Lachnospiraceae bacterium]